MSTFRNDLIERLGTRLIDVQPQNQLTERRDSAREEFEYQREREKAGRTEEQIVRYVFCAGCSLKSPTTEILSMASEHLKALG